ncbi:MAG TPA: response regulator [Dongiaceae bacterium]|nr:response regulator [Dongiaceae bacterium]
MGAAADQFDPRVSRHSLTILVVEDEPLIRLSVATELREGGYKVIEAGTVDEALVVLANDEPVDLVFCDVLMPGTKGGLSLASWMREQRPKTPVILTSGSDTVVRYFSGGTMPFVPKPYRLSELLTMIERILTKGPQPEA